MHLLLYKYRIALMSFLQEKSKEKNASSRKKSGYPEKQVLKIDEILSRSGGFARYQVWNCFRNANRGDVSYICL